MIRFRPAGEFTASDWAAAGYGLEGRARLVGVELCTALTIRADQLCLDLFGARECLEQRLQIERLNRLGRGAIEVVMGVDLAVLAFMITVVLIAMVMVMSLAFEQRTFQLGFGQLAACRCWQTKQSIRLLQPLAGVGDLALVRVAARCVLEAHQVHRRATEFDFQHRAIQRSVQLGGAVLVGAEAVMVVVIMLPGGQNETGQQSEGQGKQQTAHNELHCVWSLRYNKCLWRLASLLEAWEHATQMIWRAMMIRIRGHVGDLPVDLSIEMDDHDWAQLARQLPAVQAAQPQAQASDPAAADPHWQGAQQLLREAGRMDGPQLLAELQALTGSAQAGKRLLVRLRHSTQVKVDSGADAPVYRWVG